MFSIVHKYCGNIAKKLRNIDSINCAIIHKYGTNTIKCTENSGQTTSFTS